MLSSETSPVLCSSTSGNRLVVEESLKVKAIGYITSGKPSIKSAGDLGHCDVA